MDPETLIENKMADDSRLMEAPVAVKLIWKKLPSLLQRKIDLTRLQGFLTSIIDDEMSVKDAATAARLPVATAVELWQAIEKTGLV